MNETNDQLFKRLTGNSATGSDERDSKPVSYEVENPEKFTFINTRESYDQCLARANRKGDRRLKFVYLTYKQSYWRRFCNWIRKVNTIDSHIVSSISKKQTLFQRIKGWTNNES